MSEPFFTDVERIPYEGPQSTNDLAFRHYDAERVVLGRRMEDHLRFAVCYWHTFCWDGSDVFGAGTFDRPWQVEGDAIAQAERKTDVAFEFFAKLGVPVLLLPRPRRRTRGRRPFAKVAPTWIGSPSRSRG